MRRIALVGAALAAFAVVPSGVHGQVTVGPELAWGDSNRDFGIGAAMALAMPNLGPGWGLFVDLLVFFPDGPADYLEANGNLTYNFPLENSTGRAVRTGGSEHLERVGRSARRQREYD